MPTLSAIRPIVHLAEPELAPTEARDLIESIILDDPAAGGDRSLVCLARQAYREGVRDARWRRFSSEPAGISTTRIIGMIETALPRTPWLAGHHRIRLLVVAAWALGASQVIRAEMEATR